MGKPQLGLCGSQAFLFPFCNAFYSCFWSFLLLHLVHRWPPTSLSNKKPPSFSLKCAIGSAEGSKVISLSVPGTYEVISIVGDLSVV